MLIVFARGKTGSTVATIHRRDGVVVELSAYDRKYRVPHDLAHVVTEQALGLSGGVFGSIAGGGMFDSMRVVTGTPRHDAADRSKRLLKANKRWLGLAEVMAGIVHDAVEHDDRRNVCVRARSIWASFNADPFPWTDDDVADAVARLAELTAILEHDHTVQVTWPDSLTNPVPDAPGVKRGRRGRR